MDRWIGISIASTQLTAVGTTIHFFWDFTHHLIPHPWPTHGWVLAEMRRHMNKHVVHGAEGLLFTQAHIGAQVPETCVGLDCRCPRDMGALCEVCTVMEDACLHGRCVPLWDIFALM